MKIIEGIMMGIISAIAILIGILIGIPVIILEIILKFVMGIVDIGIIIITSFAIITFRTLYYDNKEEGDGQIAYMQGVRDGNRELTKFIMHKW